MEHGCVTIVTPVAPDRVAELTALLQSIQPAEWLSMQPALATTHFARWVVLQPDKLAAGRPPLVEYDTMPTFAPMLAFESHFDDGPDTERYLTELVNSRGDWLRRIYSHCEGYSGDVLAYLRGHRVATLAKHIGYHGQSVATIRADLALFQAIQAFLDARRPSSADASAASVHREVQEHVRRLGLHVEVEPDDPPRDDLLQIVRALGPWVLLVPILPFAAIVQLAYELGDHEPTYGAPVWAPNQVRDQEDREGAQNQLTHLAAVKPGIFRRLVLRVTLTLIGRLARYFFNEGSLGGVSTIHFAQWVETPDGMLLFFSNYDGSWESYLGDFVDKVSEGLTAVWSNTQGFPRAWLLLVAGGSRDEERFKTWTRRHQVRTEVWFRAFPDATVRDIRRARTARRQLQSNLDEAGAREFLALFDA